MSEWKIIYYEDESHVSDVADFIESLKTNEQAKVLSWITMLEEKGPNLPRPYADLLIDGIHELRIKLSGKQIRFLYFFCFGDFIIITNVFHKKADRVPEKEILKAKECRNLFLAKYQNYNSLLEEYNENT